MKCIPQLALIFALALLSACVPIPKTVTQGSLIGTFDIVYPFGTEVLVLKQDGTYEQTFTNSKGKSFSGQVSLENSIVVDDGLGGFSSTDIQQGLHSLSAGWLAGSIVLSENEDAGLYFKKHQ